MLGLWGAVVAVSALSALLGYLFLAGASGNVIAAIQSFAAGAILTMLASTMMPEAHEEGGAVVGGGDRPGFPGGLLPDQARVARRVCAKGVPIPCSSRHLVFARPWGG